MSMPDAAVHSETMQIGGSCYKFSVMQTDLGFIARWRCDRCGEVGGNAGASASIPLALQGAKGNARVHHAIAHPGSESEFPLS